MKYQTIAICGKGGAGKTTLSALFARILLEEGKRKVLLIDADHAGGLAQALQILPKKTINQIRTQTIREIKQKTSDSKDLALGIDYFLMKAITEKDNLAFLSIGRPEEVGCYCPVNSLLRQAIEILAGQFDLTIIDAEAGIEQINRKVMSRVEYLLLVSDPTGKGIKVAGEIYSVAKRLNPKTRAGLILNRIQNPFEQETISQLTDLPIIGWLEEDSRVREFDLKERSFLEFPLNASSIKTLEQILKAQEIL